MRCMPLHLQKHYDTLPPIPPHFVAFLERLAAISSGNHAGPFAASLALGGNPVAG